MKIVSVTEKDAFAMSQWDIRALETNFAGWRQDRVPDLTEAKAFERYVVEAVFRSADLSDEEINSGLFGGGNDGGTDGAFFFINHRLMLEETKMPEKPSSADLWIIQAKNSNSFSELALIKMKTFIEDMLDFNKSVESFPIYSSGVKDFIASFRSKLSDVVGVLSEIRVHFVYGSKSDHSPSTGVVHRAEQIEPAVRRHLSSAQVDVQYWDALRLLNTWRSQPDRTYSLDVVNHFPNGASFIGISRLDKFAQFLTDEAGQLRQSFLEPNVRDYNGPGNKVNGMIRNTLQSGVEEEFWWLNNGVTILAEDCNYAGGKLNIKTPEIVNGLQTSHEIFNYFSKNAITDGRMILVRVILPPNEHVRRRIVRATNSQSPVSELSLYASDDIHFEIEELFRLNGIYYDRRKGEHRRKRMPVSQIVSMRDVAQAIIAIALRLPNDARARPGKRLDTVEGYKSVFDESTNRNMYLACIQIDRAVEKYLSETSGISKDERTDLRFYMDCAVASALTGKAEPTKSEIGDLAQGLKAAMTGEILTTCHKEVLSIYKTEGGDDRAAKGPQMRDALLNALKAKYAPSTAA